MRVKRTGQSPLAFTGTLLATASSRPHADKARDRWHEIQVHRTDSNQLVVAVCYRTRCKGEADYDDAVILDSLEQVATFLEKYVSPNLSNMGCPARPEFGAQQAQLIADVEEGFKHAAGAVLDQLDCAARG
jgi:hypothetical protein